MQTKHWRRLMIALMLVVTSCSPEQIMTRDLLNETRTAHNLTPLAWDVNLNVKAQDWAEHLARTRILTHSDLPTDAPPGWQVLGENVGVGPDIPAVHTAFVDSPGHRANITDTRFDRVGVGVALGLCPRVEAACVYVVQVFARY